MRIRPVVAATLSFSAACSSSPRGVSSSDAGHPHDARPGLDARDASSAGDAHVAADSNGATACSLSVPSPPDWRLVTDGPLLKDGLGRIVFLRGVDAGGRSKFAPYVPFDFPDGGYDTTLDAFMARARSWGIDAMRVPFTWAALEPTHTTPATYDTAWIARYVALLDAAWRHGIYTVVDFHQDVYSEVFCGDGFPAWTLPDGGVDAGPPAHDCPQWSLEYFDDHSVLASFDAFWPATSTTMASYVAAWDEMMSQVSDTPGVIGFEPINEPSAGTANPTTFEQTTLTSFFTAIAADMNQKAPKALVFFDPTGVDGVVVSTSLNKPQGKNLVFSPHFYPLGPQTAAQVEAGLGKWAGYAKTWNLPVFVGEFGASNTEASTLGYMQSVFAGFDALGLGGTEWEYSVSSQLWNSETDSVVSPDGGELPVAQALIRPFARAVAGTGVKQTYDVETGAYELTFTATAGVTEVRVPDRAFEPVGKVVTVEGACVDDSAAPGEVLLRGVAGAPVTLKIERAK